VFIPQRFDLCARTDSQVVPNNRAGSRADCIKVGKLQSRKIGGADHLDKRAWPSATLDRHSGDELGVKLSQGLVIQPPAAVGRSSRIALSAASRVG